MAPRFDVSRRVLLVQLGDVGEVTERSLPSSETEQHERVDALLRWDVHTLICGAVSREVSAALELRGLRVFPFVSGPVDAVLGAFLAGELLGWAYRMPGCRRRRGLRLTRPWL